MTKRRIIVLNGTVTVAIAVIQRQDGRVLIGHRRSDHYRRPGEWEFPGGKKEKPETPEMAVVREAKEETSLTVIVKGCLTETWCNYPDGVYRHVFVYLCAPIDADPHPVSVSGDYTEMKWVAPSDKETWQDNRIPPMDRSVLEALMDGGVEKELIR